MSEIQMFDVVALLRDVPENGLVRGQVGAAVEPLAPGVWEVDFVDGDGHTYALVTLRNEDLMVLRYAPVRAA